MSFRDQLMQLEKKHRIVSISVFLRSSAKAFSALVISCQQRALALFRTVTSPCKPAALSGADLFFADGMEVDIAPVVAGQFEDAEVDH